MNHGIPIIKKVTIAHAAVAIQSTLLKGVGPKGVRSIDLYDAVKKWMTPKAYKRMLDGLFKAHALDMTQDHRLIRGPQYSQMEYQLSELLQKMKGGH